MNRNIFIVLVLVLGGTAIAGEWYWKNRDVVFCRSEAEVSLDDNLGRNHAAAGIRFIEEHFRNEDDFSISFTGESRKGRLSGMFQRKVLLPSSLGMRLAGESREVALDQESVEQAVRDEIESIPWTLSPGNFSVHLVIDEKEKLDTATDLLRASLPEMVAETTEAGLAGIYRGSDPERDAGRVAAVGAGDGQKIVLGNYWSGGREVLGFILVESSSPVGLAELISINEMQKSDEPLGAAGPEFSIRLNESGAKSFEVFTGSNVGRRTAFVVNDFARSAPQIAGAISGGNIILGLGNKGPRRSGLRLATSLKMGKAGLPDPGLKVSSVSVKCY